MKKIITIITSCILLAACNNQPAAEGEEPEETRQEILNLDLVSGYEFRIYSYENNTDIIYHIQEPEDVRKMSEFLGNNRVINYIDDGPCECDYGVLLRIFLTTGEVLKYGVEENRNDGSFVFSKWGLETICFEDKSYDDLINLIKDLGD
jgi:hypothetical protein